MTMPQFEKMIVEFEPRQYQVDQAMIDAVIEAQGPLPVPGDWDNRDEYPF